MRRNQLKKRRRNLNRKNKIWQYKPRKRSQRRKYQSQLRPRKKNQRKLSQSQLRSRRRSQRRLLSNQRPTSLKRPQRKQLKMKLHTKKLTPKSITRSTPTNTISITKRQRVMMMVRSTLRKMMSQLLRKHLLLKLSQPRSLRRLRRASTPFFKIRMMLTVMIFSENKSLRIRKS